MNKDEYVITAGFSDIESLRDFICRSIPARNLVFYRVSLAVIFTVSFELGRLVDPFLLYQFIVGSSCFYFCQRLLQKIQVRWTHFGDRTEEIDALFHGSERLTLVVLQSQLDLLSRENVLPLQAGGVMILGYVLTQALQLPIGIMNQLLPSIVLGIVYFCVLFLDQKLSQRENWQQAAAVLSHFLKNRAEQCSKHKPEE